MTSAISNSTPDHEITTSRTLNAPKELVFRAWATPEHLKNWWDPAGFTNTFIKFDFQVGGRWNFIMHGPDKGNYHNECEFTAIDEPNLIAWKRFTNPLFQVVVTFEEVSTTQTYVVFRQIFDTPEAFDKVKPFVVDKNEEVFDRLEAELLKMTT